MDNELFPYQVEGAKWLAAMPHALLADEMGLGKSAQAVHACDIIGARDILIVCSAAVRINWSREFDRFSPFDRPVTVVMKGGDTIHPGVVVISYDLIAANQAVRNTLKNRKWDCVILDEAHYLKERSTNRTKAIYGRRQYPGIAASARYVWRLSGTPAPNYANELYPHLKSAGLVNVSYWDFTFMYCTGFDGGYGFKITGHKNTQQLRQLLSKFMLRRKKEEVMQQLPKITFHAQTVERSEVELDPYFYENYFSIGIPAFLEKLKTDDAMLRVSLESINTRHDWDGRTRDKVAILEALAGSTTTLRRYIGLAKAPKIIEIIEEELASGALEKVVIFAVHAQVIEMFRERLRKYGAVTLYGGTPARKRQLNIDKFQNSPKCRVFVGQVQAAGTGITLTAAHEVVFAESSYRPDENAQAAMRCHRIGQTKPVRVRIFSCAGSVDEDVQKILANKIRELSKIID